jgi:hypothetical protein
LATISSYQRRSTAARSFAVLACHAGKAAAAAAIARAVSAAVISGTSASLPPLAGSLTAKLRPSSAASQRPSR